METATQNEVNKLKNTLQSLLDFVEEIYSQQKPLEYGQYSWAVDVIDSALSNTAEQRGKSLTSREALLAIHAELAKYVNHETNDTSMCLRIKNIINDALSNMSYNAGDDKKVREALKRICDWFDDCGLYEEAADEMDDMLEEAKNALSAPRRNCDVGTPAEQAERFKAFCATLDDEKDSGSKACNPYYILMWSQMPYEYVSHSKTT